MVRFAVVIALIVGSFGCAESALQRPTGTQPVVRHVNWKKWKRLRPEQSVAFGTYRIIAPEKSSAGGRAMLISSQSRKFQNSDLKGSINFDLLEPGSSVAHVTAKSTRNVKELNVGGGFGTIGVDDEDLMSGEIEIIGHGTATFSLSGFHKGSLGDEADGVLTVNRVRITLKEVDAALYEQGYGFAGAEVHLNDQHVGQVVCGLRETVWIDPEQPPEIRTAIACVAATILMTDRLEPDRI